MFMKVNELKHHTNHSNMCFTLHNEFQNFKDDAKYESGVTLGEVKFQDLDH
jgi:hypothetical protein